MVSTDKTKKLDQNDPVLFVETLENYIDDLNTCSITGFT